MSQPDKLLEEKATQTVDDEGAAEAVNVLRTQMAVIPVQGSSQCAPQRETPWNPPERAGLIACFDVVRVRVTVRNLDKA